MSVIGSLGRGGRSPNDPRDIRLATILERDSRGVPTYEAPPLSRDWAEARQYSWLMNDRLGCCTITGIAHLMQNFALANDEPITFTDADIVEAYSRATGYRPGDPSTDRGGLMISALKVAKNFGIGGRKIGAFARVDYSDPLEVQAAINLLGGVYVGARLPRRIIEQDIILKIPEQRDERDERDAPGSLGGHAFAVLGYDRIYYKTLLWRDPQLAELSWFNLYVDEAWAILDERWVTGERRAPNGLSMTRLHKSLQEIGR